MHIYMRTHVKINMMLSFHVSDAVTFELGSIYACTCETYSHMNLCWPSANVTMLSKMK